MNRLEIKNFFLEEVKQLQGVVLEIGFGKPNFYEKYSDQVQIYAVDFSSDVIKEARQLVDNSNENSRIKILYSSNEELPFNESSFDSIVLSFCFCCLEKPKQILDEITRVGKNGGTIISFDHVRSDGIIGILLDISAPLYASMHKNCHLNRNPINYLNRVNVSIISENKSDEKFIPWLMTKCIIKK